MTPADILRLVDRFPDRLGRVAAHFPFAFRPGIGHIYRARRAELQSYNLLVAAARQTFIYERVLRLVHFAYQNVPFYRSIYQREYFTPNMLRCFDDLKRIPTVSRAQLQEVPLDMRSALRPGRILKNTGGSSGQPLDFYVEPSAMGQEWAHMHDGWARLGYRPSALKLVFAGKCDPERILQYDPARNHYWVNIYRGSEAIADALRLLLGKRRIEYLHGYPSAICEFALYCQTSAADILQLFRPILKGVFFSSEYPAPIQREAIEKILQVPTLSWYGHTEQAILAFELNSKCDYEPYQTYGFTEALSSVDGRCMELVGTSYYNYASPFIRYRTGDGIDNLSYSDNVLRSFRIAEGRIGEFIEDRCGRSVSLTALIFGRHHRIFEMAKSVQVRQDKPGVAEFLIVPRDGTVISSETARGAFDLGGVDLEFTFEVVAKVLRTSRGKVPLLIKQDRETIRSI